MVPIRIDVFSVLIFLGIIQGLFLSIIFFRSGSNHLSNRLMGLLILILTAFSIDTFLGYSGYMVHVLHLLDVTETLNFAIAPVIYLFVVVTLSNQQRIRRSQYAHFIPAILYSLYFLLFFFQTEDYKYNAYIDYSHPHLPYIDAPAKWPEDPLFIKANINLLQMSQIALYLGLSIRQYVVWKSKNPNQLNLLVLGVLVGTGISLFNLFITNTSFERGLGEYIPGSTTAVLLYVMSFYVISKSTILKKPPPTPNTKYKKSTLPEDRASTAILRLEALMEAEQPYLDPSFSLPSLAEKLNLSTHHLSQLLNGHLNKNFYEFTAQYRVEAAKSILKDQQQLPIEHIAEQVGYYSKSSFNTAFKKQTGMTPSQYRKEPKEEL